MSEHDLGEPEIKVGGWQRLSSRVAYENPWIRVSHEQVKTPNGTDGIYGLVHFKGTAVGVVPVDEDGNTWLVRQSRYTLNQFTWEYLCAPLSDCLWFSSGRFCQVAAAPPLWIRCWRFPSRIFKRLPISNV